MGVTWICYLTGTCHFAKERIAPKVPLNLECPGRNSANSMKFFVMILQTVKQLL